MLDAFAELTDGAPIRTLVNTHSDADHVFGNQLLADAEIVSSRRSAELIRRQDPGSLKGFTRLAHGMRLVGPAAAAGGRVAASARAAARPARPRSAPTSGTCSRPFDFDGIEIAPPKREFEGELSLDVGGRKLRLIEVGPAHTAGDLIIHVPDAGVVYAGDILFIGSTPIMWAGPVINWIDALDRLLGLDADTYVPGHGPVCGRRGGRGA